MRSRRTGIFEIFSKLGRQMNLHVGNRAPLDAGDCQSMLAGIGLKLTGFCLLMPIEYPSHPLQELKGSQGRCIGAVLFLGDSLHRPCQK
jgi:hypothetical protein